MKNNFSFLAAFAMVLFTLCCSMACFKKAAYATSFEGQLSDSLISIKQLKRLHLTGAVEPIQKEWMLQAVVVANDEYDNWYKSLVIQESTGGIMLLLDGQNLFQDYPIGTLIRLRLKDLLLSDYRRMIQLVGAVDSSSGSLVTGGIPLPLFKQHIQILQDNYPIVPLQVQFKNLHDSLQGRLIQISNIEFSATDTAQTFADKKINWEQVVPLNFVLVVPSILGPAVMQILQVGPSPMEMVPYWAYILFSTQKSSS